MTTISMDFLAKFSHECRTPLNAIIGYAECMLRGYDGEVTDEQRQDLQAIIRNARDLLRLFEDNLQLAQIESGHLVLDLQPFPIHACVQAVLDSLKWQASEREVRFDVDLPTDPPPLLGDPIKVRRILLNLLDNAIKYAPGGTVTIQATVAIPYMQIRISDEGPGIPPSTQRHIFEPFHQPAQGKSGVGLGLAIVKELVDAHAGKIEVESQVGQGTTFHISLPLAIPELKEQIRCMLEEQLEPPRRDVAYRLHQWLDSTEESTSCQEATVGSSS